MQPLCPGPGNLQMSEVKKKKKNVVNGRLFPLYFPYLQNHGPSNPGLLVCSKIPSNCYLLVCFNFSQL